MRKIVYGFLKFVLIMMPFPFLLLVFVLDRGYLLNVVFDSYTRWTVLLLPVVLFMILAAVPYILTIVSAFQLLVLFEKKKGFEERMSFLKKINTYSFTYAILMSITLPFVYIFVEYDDSPGLLLGFIILTVGGYIASAFAYVLNEK